MGKTSNAVKDRWNAKAYDDLRIRIPKGRKAAVEAYARSGGESINSLVNALLREKLGLTEEEWKRGGDEDREDCGRHRNPSEV